MSEKSMDSGSYQCAANYLDSLQFHTIKLGLAPMREFLALFGNPEAELKIVHVAGTNGKGSVCSGLVSVLGRAGYRVGLYTSPHLSSPRERFRIGDDYISRDEFAEFTEKIKKVLDGRSITYFEFTTTMAFLWFAAKGVDLVVLETGLGGRLDATNVVDPLLSVITSVSIDHEAYLGSTLSEVASEKAGIIKACCPVICGSRETDVCAVVSRRADELEAPLYQLDIDFTVDWSGGKSFEYRSQGLLPKSCLAALENSKPGVIHADNSALVLASLQLLEPMGFTVSEEEIRQGLRMLAWPGRLEYFHGPRTDAAYLLDGAHNPAGVAALVATLSHYSYSRLFCVWGAMADKDVAAGLRVISEKVDHLLLTNIESDRAEKAEVMYNLLGEQGGVMGRCFANSHEALAYAEAEAEADDLILVAGSLYLLGEIRPLLLGELA